MLVPVFVLIHIQVKQEPALLTLKISLAVSCVMHIVGLALKIELYDLKSDHLERDQKKKLASINQYLLDNEEDEKIGLSYKYSTYDIVTWKFNHRRWWVFIPLVTFDFCAFCYCIWFDKDNMGMVKIGVIF